MKRSRILLAAGAAIGVAVGFQQAEPLDELRKYGSLSQGVGNVGPDGYSFVPDEMASDRFLESLAVLSRCPSVRAVFVRKIDNLKEALARLAKLEHVESLWMRKMDADEDDLASLAGMKQLRFLDLSRDPTVTDAGVAALSGLESLRYLDLTDTMVTGTGLKDRADIVSLEQLDLDGCPVTDESLAAIPRFPKLAVLHLGRTNVTDAGLMSLVGWHSLREVKWNDRMTLEGQIAFNDAFLAARRKAREAGAPIDSEDVAPIFMNKRQRIQKQP